MNKRVQLIVAVVLIFSTVLMVLPATAQEDFDWRQFEGESITVFLTEVAMSQGIRQNLQEFIDLTGIDVEYLVIGISSEQGGKTVVV